MGNDIDARVAAAHQKYTAKKEAANKSGGSSNIDARVDAAYQQYTEKKQREAAHRLYQDQNGGSSGNPWGNPFYDSIYKSQEKRKLDFYTLYREFDRLSSFEQDADTFYGSWHSQECLPSAASIPSFFRYFSISSGE